MKTTKKNEIQTAPTFEQRMLAAGFKLTPYWTHNTAGQRIRAAKWIKVIGRGNG